MRTNNLPPTRDIARELARRYSTMTHDEISVLEGLLEPMKLKRKTALVTHGVVSDRIYYIHHGLVRHYHYKGGREIVTHLGMDGSVSMSVESLFRNVPAREVIETLVPTVIYAIRKLPLEQTALHNQNIQIMYRKMLEEALIQSERYLDLICFEGARGRYERICRQMPELVRRASFVHIASLLQMSPETLSRIRTKILAEKQSANIPRPQQPN